MNGATGTNVRVLLFSPYCYPLTGAEAIVSAKLAITLLNAGLEVDVITHSEVARYYPETDGPFWSRLRDALHPVPALPGATRHILRSTPLVWSLRALRCARRLMTRARYDVIISRATPQYGHLPALLLSGSAGVPWVANWSDPMPPAKAPPPYGLGPEARIGYLAKTYLDAVCRKADWHTFPAERLRSYFLRYQPSIRAKSSVIPHVAVIGINAGIAGRDEVFTISCSGSLTHRDPTPFLKAFRSFLDTPAVSGMARAIFTGPTLAGIKQLVARMALEEWVTTEDVGTYENVLARTATSHVALNIETQEGEGIFLPSKIADIVQTGTPILTLSPRGGTVHELLQHSGGGIAVGGSDVEEIRAALVCLYQAWRDGSLMARYGSDRLLSLFGEDTVMESYRRVFRTIRVGVSSRTQMTTSVRESQAAATRETDTVEDVPPDPVIQYSAKARH